MIYVLHNICLSIEQKKVVCLGIMGVLIQYMWKMLAARCTLGLLVLSLHRCNLPSYEAGETASACRKDGYKLNLNYENMEESAAKYFNILECSNPALWLLCV